MTDKTEADLKAVGRRIREARLRAGVSGPGLTKILGLSEGSGHHKYESGARGLSTMQLGAVAKALGVSCDWIVYGREPVSALKGPMVEGRAFDARAFALPQAVYDLINTHWVDELEQADLDAMLDHLKRGLPANVHDLEMSVRLSRLVRDRSEQNHALLQAAIERRGGAFNYKAVPVAAVKTTDESPTTSAPAPAPKKRA